MLHGGGQTRHAGGGAAASFGAGAGHMVAGDRNDAFDAAVIEFVGRHGDVAG